MLTYGDGVADIDLRALIAYHKKGKKIVTLTTVQPGGRFGTIEVNNKTGKTIFSEKRKEDGGWINGGFFVLNREVSDYISSDLEPFETGALPRLANKNLLNAYRHEGFWQPMDTLREKLELEKLAKLSPAPWMDNI